MIAINVPCDGDPTGPPIASVVVTGKQWVGVSFEGTEERTFITTNEAVKLASALLQVASRQED